MTEFVSMLFASAAAPAVAAAPATAAGLQAATITGVNAGIAGVQSAAAAGAASGGFMSQMATGFTALSALSSLAGGVMTAGSMRTQAEAQDAQARQQLTQSMQRSNKIRRSLLETVAGQRAGYAAMGIDTGSGTPAAAERAASEEAERQLSYERDDAIIRYRMRRQRGRGLRGQAGAAIGGGIGDAAGTIGGQMIREVRRG